MITGDKCGPNFLIFVLRLRENPWKTSTRKLIRPGIELGPAAWEVKTLPLDYSGGHIMKILKSVLPKGRSFTANAGTKVAVLLKGRSSTANSGNTVALLLGIHRCCSFPLLFTPHSLFSIWTDLERSEKIPKAPKWRWGEWIWLTGPSGLHRFTTRVKYQFHQGFWPDQRSGNPNTLRPHSSILQHCCTLKPQWCFLFSNFSRWVVKSTAIPFRFLSKTTSLTWMTGTRRSRLQTVSKVI